MVAGLFVLVGNVRCARFPFFAFSFYIFRQALEALYRMKTILSLVVVFLVAYAANSQARPIKAAEYDRAVDPAVDKTNKALPLISTWTTEQLVNGKVIRRS